jgi:hypothetical protein
VTVKQVGFNQESIIMLQNTRSIVRSIAVLILAGAIAPIANAGLVGSLLTPTFAAKQTKIAIVPIKLFNKGDESQTVKVDGTVYTVAPHASITFKAPTGTPGKGYVKGDVLFAVSPEMKGETIMFN